MLKVTGEALMDCPRCGSMMTEAQKQGVLIDVCAGCGGIWLDKGELAKVLNYMKEAEQSLDNELNMAGQRDQHASVHRQEYDSHHEDRRYEQEGRHDDKRRYEYDHNYGHRKKMGLQKLFDIFD